MAYRKLNTEWIPFSTLHGFVRLVLLVDWDPIGVFGYAGAMDEYDSYATEICSMLCGKVSREQLVAHLDDLEKNAMGGLGERPAQAQVADKLLLVYEKITDAERHWPTE